MEKEEETLSVATCHPTVVSIAAKMIEKTVRDRRFVSTALRKAEFLKFRFCAGWTHAEVAALLDVSEQTARRHWQVRQDPALPVDPRGVTAFPRKWRIISQHE